ncbi:serine/threonine-protein kinase [Gordonia humi]|uniref:serine/threonine-protein kinase n=1 Tax=Gordonia humi TaxID=686429 RepID=UPI0036225729
MATPDESGSTLGPYRLVRLLGRGGMGEVYEAVDEVKDRTVALKILPAHLADDEGFRARFLRESQTVARLGDPHVVPIHDYGEIDGRLFLDMRIVRGRDLRSIIDDGPLPPGRAVAIIAQIAGALDAAHSSGLLHRDVKPDNILVDENDFAYLVDFGIAQTAGATRLTQTGTAIGSFAYMAPERFGDADLTPASDVYSLACVLYETITGSPPFAVTSIEQIISGHLSRPVPPTGTVLDPVIAAGSMKDRAARIPSCGAFADAARGALAGQYAPHARGAVRAVRPAAPGISPREDRAHRRARRGGGRGRRDRHLVRGTRHRSGCADDRRGHLDAPRALGRSAASADDHRHRDARSDGHETDDHRDDDSDTRRRGPRTVDADHLPAVRRPNRDVRLQRRRPGHVRTRGGHCSGAASGIVVSAHRPVVLLAAATPERQPRLRRLPGGFLLAETCRIKAEVGGDAYARRLDDVTAVGVDVC